MNYKKKINFLYYPNYFLIFKPKFSEKFIN